MVAFLGPGHPLRRNPEDGREGAGEPHPVGARESGVPLPWYLRAMPVRSDAGGPNHGRHRTSDGHRFSRSAAGD